MDDRVSDAISNIFFSPFRPASILRNLRVEFNIYFIEAFDEYMSKTLKPTIEEVPHPPEPMRKKLMRGCLTYFNEHVCKRADM